MRALALLVSCAVALTGCLGAADPESPEDATPVETPAATGTGEGGVSGPSGAYRLEGASESGGDNVLHPYRLPGGKPRAAAERVFEGEVKPQDCTLPTSFFGLGQRWRAHEFSDLFEAGDVVEFHVILEWENTDQNWADLHLWVSTPGAPNTFISDTSAQTRGKVTQEISGQLYWRGSDDEAWTGLQCWYAANAAAIPYTLTVHVSYAANAIPVNTPILFDVPEEATRVFVSGVPTRGDAVTSHFRIFTPTDELLGEFALNSDERAEVVDIPAPGAYVVIVDHTENGFVAMGADAPLPNPDLVALETDFARVELYDQPTPGPAAATISFNVPRVPLALYMWADAPPDGTASGKDVQLDVEGPRGLVLHRVISGFVATNSPFRMWIGLPGLNWEWQYDHHALAVGDHVATLDAAELHGTVVLFWSTYLRPGEEGQGLPEIAPTNAAAKLVAPRL